MYFLQTLSSCVLSLVLSLKKFVFGNAGLVLRTCILSTGKGILPYLIEPELMSYIKSRVVPIYL